MKVDGILPIGSVVLLEGGKKRIMIIGYLGIKDEKANEFYEYTGCPYPEGLLDQNRIYAFNTENIKEIYYRGYSDKETRDFNKKMESFKSKYVVNGKLIKSVGKILEELSNKGR